MRLNTHKLQTCSNVYYVRFTHTRNKNIDAYIDICIPFPFLSPSLSCFLSLPFRIYEFFAKAVDSPRGNLARDRTVENLCSLYGEARELFGRIFLTVKVSLVVRYLKNRNRRKKFRFSKILIDKACWSPYCRMSGIFLTDARDKSRNDFQRSSLLSFYSFSCIRCSFDQ